MSAENQAEYIENQIRVKLSGLSPVVLEIQDDSLHHQGHAGAAGGGHYHLSIVSAAFVGRSRLARHRMVYDCLGEMMGERIHALAIQAHTPEEFF